jgi:quercetin dioxygenase-like cupin family protein
MLWHFDCLLAINGAKAKIQESTIMKQLTAVAFIITIFATGSLPAFAQKIEGVVVTKILTTTSTVTGQKLELPTQNLQVIGSTFDIAPGAKLPRHEHPFARYAYVLQGELEVNYEGSGSKVYKTGELIVEAVNTWHSAQNKGTVPVKLLVIDQVEAGKSNTILAQ